MERERGLWPCVKCKESLGRIAFGEFVWTKGVEGSTDGVNVVFRCPHCGAPKVWFSKPRDRFTAAVESLAAEIARGVTRLSKES